MGDYGPLLLAPPEGLGALQALYQVGVLYYVFFFFFFFFTYCDAQNYMIQQEMLLIKSGWQWTGNSEAVNFSNYCWKCFGNPKAPFMEGKKTKHCDGLCPKWGGGFRLREHTHKKKTPLIWALPGRGGGGSGLTQIAWSTFFYLGISQTRGGVGLPKLENFDF